MGKVFVAGRKLKIGPDVRRWEPSLSSESPDRRKGVEFRHGEVHEADLSPDQQENFPLYLENVRPKHVGSYELLLGRSKKEEAYKQMADFGFFRRAVSIDGEDGDGEAKWRADGVATDGRLAL